MKNGRHAALGFLAAGATLLLAVIALARAGLGEADNPKQAPPRSTFSLEQAQAFSNHPVYYAGEQVDGLPLVSVLRRTGTADYISFIYGTCIVEADTGCAPPAEVQVWPACKRHLALYDQSVPGTPIPHATTVRGVPAAVFDDGQRLEIHTDRSLVVVFADSEARLRRIAGALRGVNVNTPPEARLPAPVAGAVEGNLSC